MSDADDQMGGTGGQTGRPPGGPPPTPASREAEQASEEERKALDDGVTEASEESFPASDPPASY